MEDSNRKIGMEIHRLDNIITRILEARVKAAGFDEVTLMHGWIIRYLYENQDRDVYQRDIEKFCSIGRSTVSNIIQLMEKKGLIRRESVENDARLKRLVLTPKGFKHCEVVENAITEVNEEMTVGIEPDDLVIFLKIIRKISGNLEKHKKDCRVMSEAVEKRAKED